MKEIRSKSMDIFFLSFVFFLIVTLINSDTHASDSMGCPDINNDEQINKAVALIEKGKKQFKRDVIMQGMELLTRLKEKYDQCPLYHYNLSTGYSYMVNISDFEKKNDQAEKEIKSGIKEAEISVGLDDNFSDSHRLLGLLYGRLIGIKGGISRATYGVMYGSKSSAALDKALSLDPNNYKAHLAKGISKTKTPAMFGGDLDNAIELFNKALELSPESEDVQIWLGIAYRLKGKIPESEAVLKTVLGKNPENYWAKLELAKIED